MAGEKGAAAGEDVEPGGDVGRGAGESVGEKIPFTPAAIETLRHAVVEALELGHNYIGTEHLLLALLREPNTPAAVALATLGVTYDQTRAVVIDLLAGYHKA